MKKKNLFSVLIVCIMCLLFTLTGCNNNVDNNPNDDINGDTRTYYTVTFDSRGGSAVESQSIREGNLVARPQTPTKSGYSLTGWFKQDDTEWNFNTDKVNSNITLYAGWQATGNQPSDTPKNLCEVYMTFGNETITAQLYDNATARDLVSRLPLTLSFSDFNNTEKIAYLPNGSSDLDTNDAPDTFTPAAGDMTVYIPWGNIAIFYNAFRASSGLAPFGKIGNDDIVKLSQISNNTQITITKEKPNKPTDEQKILVAYFSCTNTTKGVAETICGQIEGADIYRITPTVPYTSADLNYNNSSCRANREQNDSSARPEITGSVENIEQYDVIFIGYPIWWGQAPKIIYTFFESYDYDFDGVTIIPFCTSGSSGMGTSATNLHSLAPNANWKSGARISGNNVSALIAQMN
ncbi:MAG: flavodoxin [Eubacteriales bacterium]